MSVTRVGKRIGGAPSGGLIGQVLAKLSGDSGDYAWVEPTAASPLPSGSVMDFATPVLPPGYLAADGASYLESEYALLAANMAGIHSANIYISNLPGGEFKYDFTGKPWLGPISTGGQVLAVPVKVHISFGKFPGAGALAPDTEYWLRYTAFPLSGDPAFTLHPTQADANINANIVNLGDGVMATAYEGRWVATIEVAGRFRVPNYSVNGGVFRRAWPNVTNIRVGNYYTDTMAAHTHFTLGEYARRGNKGVAPFITAATDVAYHGGPASEGQDYILSTDGGWNPTVGRSSQVGGWENTPKYVSVLVGIKT